MPGARYVRLTSLARRSSTWDVAIEAIGRRRAPVRRARRVGRPGEVGRAHCSAGEVTGGEPPDIGSSRRASRDARAAGSSSVLSLRGLRARSRPGATRSPAPRPEPSRASAFIDASAGSRMRSELCVDCYPRASPPCLASHDGDRSRQAGLRRRGGADPRRPPALRGAAARPARQHQRPRRRTHAFATLHVAHAEAEEKYVYPKLRRKDAITEHEAEHGEEEHAEGHEALLAVLELKGTDTQAFDDAVEELAKAVNHHLTEEELTILNPAREEVGERVRADLGEAFATERNRQVDDGCGVDHQRTADRRRGPQGGAARRQRRGRGRVAARPVPAAAAACAAAGAAPSPACARCGACWTR